MRDIEKNSAGFTLIEMLVGIVIGMIVVAAASVMMVSVLKSQKDVTASARLNQELGAAMAVMSNEIRRAGFRICDIDDPNFECPDVIEKPFIGYALGEDIVIADVDGDVDPNDGDCILYRYNADVDGDGHDGDTDIVDDADDDDLSEHRGFRLKNNIIQMTHYPLNHDGIEAKCDDDLATVTQFKWADLTDSNAVNITDLSFTTAGSKCRNMEESKNWYWMVVGANETDLACELDDSIALPSCTPLTTGVSTCVSPLMETDDDIFATHQVTIRVEAELSGDSTVTKILNSSVKVANPWVGKAP